MVVVQHLSSFRMKEKNRFFHLKALMKMNEDDKWFERVVHNVCIAKSCSGKVEEFVVRRHSRTMEMLLSSMDVYELILHHIQNSICCWFSFSFCSWYDMISDMLLFWQAYWLTFRDYSFALYGNKIVTNSGILKFLEIAIELLETSKQTKPIYSLPLLLFRNKRIIISILL